MSPPHKHSGGREMKLKCMDCGKEFAGASGPPPDKRCNACLAEQLRWLRVQPQEEQDRIIAKALERAAAVRKAAKA